MSVNPSENEVAKIVEEVVRKLHLQSVSDAAWSAKGGSGGAAAGVNAKFGPQVGVHTSVDEAVAEAARAFQEYRKVNLEKRHQIIAAIRECAIANAETWAKDAVAETGYGRVEDKIKKKILVARKTPGPESIGSEVTTGDHGLTLTEHAPYGVILSITPTTNPVATLVNNAISMLSGGNVVVYNFHPSAKGVCCKALVAVNQAIASVGGPRILLHAMAEPTHETGAALMRHPRVRLVVVTGGPGVVQEAFRAGKKVIAAGPGNPPVVVDDTAHLDEAARDVIAGNSFDNNIMCTCEKELLVYDSVAAPLKDRMKKMGGYEVAGGDVDRLMKVVLTPEGKANRKWIGKDARLILKEMGVSVGDEIRTIFCETDRRHLFVGNEMMMPLIPLVRVKHIDEAIEVALDAEHGYRHTAVMHSRNLDHLHRMAVATDVSIFVKNGPNYSGLGMGGESWTTMTIASPTGEGCTYAKTFTRERRCALIDSFRII